MIGAVRQEWALVGGVPRHVEEFAHLPPKDRPGATCLECKEAVIFKCGVVRSHYVAHKVANVECGAASGEGAVHYNAKLYLASALGKTDRFEAYRKCVRCDVVNGSERLSYCYDSVELEYTHPNRLRADVALLSRGELVCAIEVYVSHRCECWKVVFHDDAGIPCIEVSARHALGWHPDKPLTPTAIHGIERWVCAGCLEKAARGAEFLRAACDSRLRSLQLQQPPSRAQHGTGKIRRKIIAVQKLFFTAPLADLPFSQSFITVEYMEEELGGASINRRLSVLDSSTVIKTLHEAVPPYDEQKSEEFKTAYRKYLRELEEAYGSLRKGRWLTFPKGGEAPHM